MEKSALQCVMRMRCFYHQTNRPSKDGTQSGNFIPNSAHLKIDEWRQLSNIDRSFTPLYTSSRLAHYHQTKFFEAKARAFDVMSTTPHESIS